MSATRKRASSWSVFSAKTLGRQLLDGGSTVQFQGKEWPLKAEVVHLEGFSGHADQEELVNHLAPLAATMRRLRLIHGEPLAAEALADRLRECGFHDVAVPAAGERLELAGE